MLEINSEGGIAMSPETSLATKFDDLKGKLQNAILQGYPNPDRKGCPSHLIIEELAMLPVDKSIKDESMWHHITHCSECYREFLEQTKVRQNLRARQLGWVTRMWQVLKGRPATDAHSR